MFLSSCVGGTEVPLLVQICAGKPGVIKVLAKGSAGQRASKRTMQSDIISILKTAANDWTDGWAVKITVKLSPLISNHVLLMPIKRVGQ